MNNRLKHICLTLMLVVLMPMQALAQDPVPVTVSGQVTIHNKENGKDIHERVEYTMLTKAEAQKAKAAFDKLTGDGDKSQSIKEDEIEAIDRLKRKYGFVKKNTTRASGRFSINAATTLCLLFITGQESKVSDIIEIVEGKTEYDVVINVQRLREVVKQGNAVEREFIGGGNGDTGDGNCYFHISLNIPKGYGKESSRLIIQTYAVDCQTDDTLAYCDPLVYEGREYHTLQNRRMDYDYFANDKLAGAYHDRMEITSDDWIRIDTTVVYQKPDKNLTYRGPYTYVLEDYHHVYKRGGWGGTCLVERPFKFLDFTPALAEIPLTEEFREDAQSQFGQENRDLQLRFVVGKDVLEEDSMNQVNIDKLISELRSYGEKLVAPKIQGYASPDGGMKVNQDLALRRAQYAARIIQRYLPAGTTVSSSSSVYTWNDVADALAKKGLQDYADQVRAIAARTDSPDRELKMLDFYATDVEPILESMRAMRASYQYLRAKVLTADEAVEEYYSHKRDYQLGKKKFSNGDFWNIYNNLNDEAEADSLTLLAYNYITKDPEYATENIIAPYVANRYAIYNLNKGTPNARILEPFIDLSYHNVNAKKAIDDFLTITINRKEILLNQAVTYFQEQKLDSALFFINWLHKANVSDVTLDNMEKYMNLKRLHAIHNKTFQERQTYEAAKKFVLSVSDENKAILYTEIPDWGMTDEAMKYVDKMPDNSAKKWYLKALLWVDKAGKEPRDFDESEKVDDTPGFKLLTPAEEDSLMVSDPGEYNKYMADLVAWQNQCDSIKAARPQKADDGIDIEDIPYYLAYFQHAFELEPLFKRIYFTEGHVSEDMRKLYKYKNKNIPAYRKLFRLLYEQDQKRKENELELNGDPEEGGGNEEKD
jgi:hypothetical protein